ncbi:MAG: hypothetical protein WDO14_22870 [Bacteroidota bacterium]
MEWFSKNKTWLIAIGFFILSTTLRFLSGDQTHHPTGWDGYYYVMQVHSWMTSGHMQSPDYSLIYPYFTIITFIVHDPIPGFKIGTALISGLLTISIFYYLIRKDVALMIVCAACSYIAFSPLVTYFILQFPKNALGFVFFILFMSSLKRLSFWTAVFFLCTILTHRMTGTFALITIVVYAFRSVSWKWIVAGAVVVIAIGFLPGIIHISDLARLDGQFTATPHWAPFTFTKIFPTSLNWFFEADLVLITIMTIACTVLMFINDKSMESWTWFSLVIISLFPFFSFAPGDLGHRFFMIAPIVIIVLISLLAKPAPVASISWTSLLILLSFFSWKSYKPWAFDAPNKVYSTIVERLTDRYNSATYPLVIAHKGLAEMIIFKTDFDALNWLPPEDISTDSVLRITHGVTNSDFRKYLGENELSGVKTISSGYFTLPETTWQRFVTAAKKENSPTVIRRIYGDNNPMKPRPYFIRKGKKQ